MPATIHSLLLELIDLYITLSDFKLDDEGKPLHWNQSEQYREIQESMDIDPSGITGALILSSLIAGIIKSTHIPVTDILEMSDDVVKRIEMFSSASRIMRSDPIVVVLNSFKEQLTASLTHYSDSDLTPSVCELLKDEAFISHIRLKSFNSLKHLKVDQFLQGKPESDSVKPVYVKNVHQWWNINSLLEAAVKMPSGVSLNLIRTPNEYQCYFAFVIRNGGNLYVLSDLKEQSHPLSSSMSRRPDRRMSERVRENYFPYELMGIELDDDNELYFVESTSSEIAVHQSEAVPVKPISELEPESFIWVSMMLDLIVEKFWGEGVHLESLSYTGEMIKIPDRLTHTADNAQLPINVDQSITLPELAVDDLLTGNCDEAAMGKQGELRLRWMESRYSDKVCPSTLNHISLPEAEHHSPDITLVPYMHRNGHWLSSVPDPGEKAGPLVSLSQLSSVTFGTATKLDHDRKFLGRYNLAKQITELANHEYLARHQEIKQWYHEALSNNIENLLKMIGCGELWVTTLAAEPFGDTIRGNRHGSIQYNSIGFSHDNVEREDKKCSRGFMEMYFKKVDLRFNHDLYIGGAFINKTLSYQCAVTEAKANCYAVFYPTNAHELCLATGLNRDQLPDVLQHFNARERYIGNPILQRIDPMEWAAKDPWSEIFDFRFMVPLTKSALRKLKKDPANPDPDYLMTEGLATVSADRMSYS